MDITEAPTFQMVAHEPRPGPRARDCAHTACPSFRGFACRVLPQLPNCPVFEVKARLTLAEFALSARNSLVRFEPLAVFLDLDLAAGPRPPAKRVIEAAPPASSRTRRVIGARPRQPSASHPKAGGAPAGARPRAAATGAVPGGVTSSRSAGGRRGSVATPGRPRRRRRPTPSEPRWPWSPSTGPAGRRTAQ